MKLRTKLILAFLLLSVLPLTAVTLYSYSSSLRAFHRTVEAQSGTLATEMGQRMELVTADLGQRLDRLSQQSDGPEVVAAAEERGPSSQAVRASVMKWLSDAAPLVERVEFVPNLHPAIDPDQEVKRLVGEDPTPDLQSPPSPPSPPPPPSGRAFPRPASRPALRMDGAGGSGGSGGRGGGDSIVRRQVARSPRPPRPPKPQLRKWVVDLSNLKAAGEYAETEAAIADATIAGVKVLTGLVGEQVTKEISTRISEGINTGLKEAADAIRREAEKLTNHNAQYRRAIMAATAKKFDVDVKRDGEVVGTINAKLNTSQLLATVLSATRRDQGEIPFAIDTDHQIHTVHPNDRRILASRAVLSRVRQAEANANAHPDQGDPTVTRIDDDWIVVTRKDQSGVTFGIARPIGDSLRDIRRASGRNLGLGLGVIGLAFIGIIPLSSRMTRNLAALDGGVRQLAKGDLAVRVPVRSRDEVGQLAQAFNQMAQDLEAHQKLIVDQQRLHRELELCRRIQTEMLPKAPLWVGLTEVTGVSIPAREVGGDFFNYFMLPGGDLAVLVGDVSGKGVSAALLMANIQATLRARLPLESNLVNLVAAMDREVEQNTPRGVYVTLFVGIFDPIRKVLRYVNAGHNPQFVLRVAGGLERLSSTGLPVGLFAGHNYEEQSVDLADGDLLFFFTDGMVETLNEQGDMFGTERLEALLMRAHLDEIGLMLTNIEESVRTFRGNAELYDDATMMALRLGAAPTGPASSVV